jgi:hypothetical protein
MVFVMLVWFEKGSFFSFIKRMAIIVLVFYAAIIIIYLPDPRLLGPHLFLNSDLSRLGLEWAEPILRRIPLPDTFIKGVIYTMLLGQRVHPLKGASSKKTPLPAKIINFFCLRCASIRARRLSAFCTRYFVLVGFPLTANYFAPVTHRDQGLLCVKHYA